MTLRTTKLGTFLLEEDGPFQSLDDAIAFNLDEQKNVSIQVSIDDGEDDAAPTGTPVGSWQLYFSGQEDAEFARNTMADTGDASLASIVPNGNNLVRAMANFEKAPGARGKLIYAWSSGTARATVYVTVS